MLDIIFRRGNSRCDGVSRRDFLRVGAGGGVGLAGGARRTSDPPPGGGDEGPGRGGVLVFHGGGLSHHDSFDPKPEAPAEVRGKYTTIATSVPGLRVTEMLPRMSKVMHKVALVRSGAHNNDHHETATNWVLSGRFGT